MDIKKYIETAYKTACDNGFHDVQRPIEHWLMLVLTEVSEAVEADRKRKHASIVMFERESTTPQPAGNETEHWKFCFEQFVKDTLADEFADICIRLFDLAGTFGFDIEELDLQLLSERYKNKFKLKSFTLVAYELCQLLTEKDPDVTTVQLAVAYMQCWAASLRINLEWHIEHKMQYNALRTRLHGKKY